MADTNDFDLFIGLVLARLYEARPARITLEFTNFIEPIDSDEDIYDGNKIDNWQNTVFWLREEGYIRDKGLYSSERAWIIMEAELTEKGFRALNSLPAHLKGQVGQPSFGSQLVDLGKKTGWKAATKIAESGGDQASKQASHAIGELIKSWFS